MLCADNTYFWYALLVQKPIRFMSTTPKKKKYIIILCTATYTCNMHTSYECKLIHFTTINKQSALLWLFLQCQYYYPFFSCLVILLIIFFFLFSLLCSWTKCWVSWESTSDECFGGHTHEQSVFSISGWMAICCLVVI